MLLIRIETDRYVRPKIPSHLRYCTQPKYVAINNNCLKIEDEVHFLLNCCQHTDVRATLMANIDYPNFPNLSDDAKFRVLLTNRKYIYDVGRYAIKAFENRVT